MIVITLSQINQIRGFVVEETKKSITNEQAEREYVEKNVPLINEAFKLIRQQRYFEFFHTALFDLFKSLGVKNGESIGADQLADEILKILSMSAVSVEEIDEVGKLLDVLSDTNGFQFVLQGELGFSITSFLVPALTLIREVKGNVKSNTEHKDLKNTIHEKTLQNLKAVFFETLTTDIEKIIKTLSKKNELNKQITQSQIASMANGFYYIDALGLQYVKEQMLEYFKYLDEKLGEADQKEIYVHLVLKLLMEKASDVGMEVKDIKTAVSLRSGLGQLCLDIFETNGNSIGNGKFLPILVNYENSPPLRREESYKFFKNIVKRKPQADSTRDVLLTLSFLKAYLANINKKMIKSGEKKQKLPLKVVGKGNKFAKWLVVAAENAFGLKPEINIEKISKQNLKDRLDNLINLIDLTLVQYISHFSARDQHALALFERFMAIPIKKEHEFNSYTQKIEQAFKIISVGYDLLLQGQYEQISKVFEAIDKGIEISRQQGNQERSMTLEKGLVELRDGLLELYSSDIGLFKQGQQEEVLQRVCNAKHVSAQAILVIASITDEKLRNEWIGSYLNYLFEKAKDINVQEDNATFFAKRAAYVVGFVEAQFGIGKASSTLCQIAQAFNNRVFAFYGNHLRTPEACYIDMSFIDKSGKSKKSILLDKIIGDEKKEGTFLYALEKYNKQKSIGSFLGKATPKNSNLGKMSRKNSHEFFKSFISELGKQDGMNEEEKIYKFMFLLSLCLPALISFEKQNEKESKFLVYLTQAAVSLMPELRDITVSKKEDAIKQTSNILDAIKGKIVILGEQSYSKDQRKAELLSNLINAIIREEPDRNGVCKDAFDFVLAILFAETKQQLQLALDSIKGKKGTIDIFSNEIDAFKELAKMDQNFAVKWSNASIKPAVQARNVLMSQVRKEAEPSLDNAANPGSTTS